MKDSDSELYSTIYHSFMTDLMTAFESVNSAPGTVNNMVTDWWGKYLGEMQSLTTEYLEECINNKDVTLSDVADRHFSFLEKMHRILSHSIDNSLESFLYTDPKLKQRLRFFIRQALSASSPKNFPLLNSDVRNAFLMSNGQNFVSGIYNLNVDIKNSNTLLNITLTDKSAFIVGKDLACSAGKVVFRNEIFELIQYAPLTKEVNPIPLLIIPPLINKYYILDLDVKKSMVQWLLKKGHTVFMISWRDPDESMKDFGFEKYVLDGVNRAVDVAEAIVGSKKVHAMGYCLGGTLLAATLGYYAARRRKNKIQTATYLTTLLDFSTPGELGSYICEPIISAIEKQITDIGYFDKYTLNITFNLLRENNLYWNYYINNYLKGLKAKKSDFLFWSGDGINMTAACCKDLLNKFYLNNELAKPRACKIGGVYIDLAKIKTPGYFMSTSDDHISLWEGVYNGMKLFSAETSFILGMSGHVAGVVNPPDNKKYGFWENKKSFATAAEWRDKAEYHEGSWWEHWECWLNKFETVHKVPSNNHLGNDKYPTITDAPGEYVF